MNGYAGVHEIQNIHQVKSRHPKLNFDVEVIRFSSYPRLFPSVEYVWLVNHLCFQNGIIIRADNITKKIYNARIGIILQHGLPYYGINRNNKSESRALKSSHS